MKSTTLADMIAGKTLYLVSPEETVRNACIMLTSANIGALPVADADGSLVGMLSERDVIQRSIIVYRPSDATAVRQVMTSNPQWLPPDAAPQEAFEVMINGRFRHLPICDNGQLVGIVSIRDFNPPARSIRERLRRKTKKAARA